VSKNACVAEMNIVVILLLLVTNTLGTVGVLPELHMYIYTYIYIFIVYLTAGDAVASLTEALCYKPEGRGVRFLTRSLFCFHFT
jgi:hypothetical protein